VLHLAVEWHGNRDGSEVNYSFDDVYHIMMQRTTINFDSRKKGHAYQSLYGQVNIL
jgi:hypothetical protein